MIGLHCSRMYTRTTCSYVHMYACTCSAAIRHGPCQTNLGDQVKVRSSSMRCCLGWGPVGVLVSVEVGMVGDLPPTWWPILLQSFM